MELRCVMCCKVVMKDVTGKKLPGTVTLCKECYSDLLNHNKSFENDSDYNANNNDQMSKENLQSLIDLFGIKL